MRTLNNLISGKGFDKYQTGLKARFDAYGYTYKYSKNQEGTPYLSLKFDTPKFLGLVVVTESGNLSLKICDQETNAVYMNIEYDIKTADQFFILYPQLFFYLRENRD